MAESFAAQRAQMMRDLQQRGIKNRVLLNAFAAVPRELFVLPSYRSEAYRDGPLPLPAGQTISQPYVVALMIQLLQLQRSDRILEIGSGSGYAAAVLAQLVDTVVHTVERHRVLADYARGRLRFAGVENVRVHHGDGTLGWSEAAPYDAIIIAAGGPQEPPALLAQLARGGRLVMPVGKQPRGQMLVRVRRDQQGRLRRKRITPVRFVPLIGEEGWPRTKICRKKGTRRFTEKAEIHGGKIKNLRVSPPAKGRLSVYLRVPFACNQFNHSLSKAVAICQPFCFLRQSG